MPDHLTPENMEAFVRATSFDTPHKQKMKAIEHLLLQCIPSEFREILNQIFAGESPHETIEYRKVAA